MPAEEQVDHRIRGEAARRRQGLAVLELAGRQHGVVARWQLVKLRLGRGAIERWIAHGRLVVVHRGVYAVGHRLLTVEGRWSAGVLAGGPGAVLSHRSAADLWELTGLSRPRADVTVGVRRTPRAGIRFHRIVLAADEATVRAGIPVSTVARTLFDLAAVTTRARLEQAISVAEHRTLADTTSLPELIERYPRRRGIVNLRAALESHRLGLGRAHSELEIRFLEFIAARELSRPETNAVVEVAGRSLEVDCLWPSARLIAELDSRRHHGDAGAFETDRARDLALLGAGYRTARITWRRLHIDPDAVESELRRALARGAG